jgi:3-dehydroquinate synthase
MTETRIVTVELGRAAYPVYVGTGILGDPAVWSAHLGNGKVLIVSNEVVAPLYAETLRAALPGKEVHLQILPDGEPHKTLNHWSGIIDRLVEIQARRDATVIALGGGVVGDISGFAAATYMRGIRLLQAPTTLLAQVDAAVGGKTGVNHVRGKNLIGAFHQPAAVVADTATLDTLPPREFGAGLAEVVKYGAVMDTALLEWLEGSVNAIGERRPEALRHLVTRSVENKARIVSADEFEAGIRAILNFGHSFGHALEAVTAYTDYLHGEAVAIGMVIAARLSERRGLCPQGTAARLCGLLQALELPYEVPHRVPTAVLVEAMGLDKKARAGGLRLILLQQPGEAVIDDRSSDREIIDAIEACRPTSRAS